MTTSIKTSTKMRKTRTASSLPSLKPSRKTKTTTATQSEFSNMAMPSRNSF